MEGEYYPKSPSTEFLSSPILEGFGYIQKNKLSCVDYFMLFFNVILKES